MVRPLAIKWIVMPNETSETLQVGQFGVVTQYFREPSSSICGGGAENATVNVKKEGGDGCTGWAMVAPAPDKVLHLRDLAIVNEGIQNRFVFENGTLICERVVFNSKLRSSEAPHVSGPIGAKVACLGCTFEPGTSTSFGDGRCELYIQALQS